MYVVGSCGLFGNVKKKILRHTFGLWSILVVIVNADKKLFKKRIWLPYNLWAGKFKLTNVL